jgi:hypothetical protein
MRKRSTGSGRTPLLAAHAFPVEASGVDARSACRVLDLVVVDEIGRAEDEYLAHHVRVLLVAAHEADHLAAGGVFDDAGEAVAHHLLELHALLDHRRAAATVEQCLLDAREAAAQHADHQVVVEVGLRSGRAAAVELLQQSDHPVRDRRQHIAMGLRLLLDGFWIHSDTIVLAGGANAS